MEQPLISSMVSLLLRYFLPLLLLVFLSIRWLFNSQSSNKRLPPSPPKLPIIGNLHQLGLAPHRSLQSLAHRHGQLMLLHLGNKPALVVSSADAAREIMKTHDLVFSNRPQSNVAKRLLYDYKEVSMAPYGELWRQLKSIFVLQLLSNRRVQSFHRLREEETALMMKKIEDHFCSSSSPLNLREVFVLLTNDVACRAAFGRKYSEGERGKRFIRMLRDFMGLLGSLDIGDFIPCIGWVNHVTGFYAKLDRVAKELDEFLEQVVEERMNVVDWKRTTSKSDEKAVEDKGREDFLDILIRIHKDRDSGASIDRDCIKALILDIFAAGTDTTSTVLEWAMTELLRHPEVMKKLQNEVKDIAKGKSNIVDEDLVEMHYLKAVVKETMRLHPPIPLLVPHAARSDARVMGYDIAAGTMIMTNAWAIGRDPMSWADHDQFKPERFLNSSIDFKGRDFELIPFGAGRRGCPGASFAIATNELALANLVHKFDWTLPGGAEGKDLDMTECTAVTTRRRAPLLAVATLTSC